MCDFVSVTEVSGEKVSAEQIERIKNRYCWAKKYCCDKDVLEVACGSGQGLGLIGSCANTLTAGDHSPAVLQTAMDHYKDRVPLEVFDAQNIPFGGNKFDVIVIFEAIYYLPDFVRFLHECKRVLRDKGKILISMPNVTLADFNKSPYSHQYFNIDELKDALDVNNFDSEFFGYLDVKNISIRQKLFRPIKKLAVNLGLIPKTMAGKQLLKRIVFGGLVEMPSELFIEDCENCDHVDLLTGSESSHKVIYCVATLK